MEKKEEEENAERLICNMMLFGKSSEGLRALNQESGIGVLQPARALEELSITY